MRNTFAIWETVAIVKYEVAIALSRNFVMKSHNFGNLGKIQF